MIDINGNEMLPFGDCSFNTADNGYWYRQSSKDNENLCDYWDPEGNLYEKIEVNNIYDFAPIKKNNNKYSVYVFADRDYTLEADAVNSVSQYPGLVILIDHVSNGSKCALYDILTGRELLGDDYSNIVSIDKYIYAYKDGEWEVYEVQQ